MKNYDLFIFSGQSNMQGQTECDPNDTPIKNAVEYRFLTDETVPLKNPVGEDIGEKGQEQLLASHLGHGSLVPYFVDTYIQKTGNFAVAVPAAKGATVIEQWQKHSPDGEARYRALAEKVRAAEKKCGKPRKRCFIWLQGESDALIGTTKQAYIEKMLAFRDDLEKDLGIDRFMMILVGYFAANYGRKAADEVIMDAQRTLAKEYGFDLLTDVTAELSLNPACCNPDAVGHYNNAAMKVIGNRAGAAAAELAASRGVEMIRNRGNGMGD